MIRWAPVGERTEAGVVRLAAGAQQQVVEGSLWRVVAGALQPESRPVAAAPAGSALGRLRVTRVGAVGSEAEIVDEVTPGAIAPPARALVESLPSDDLRLAVAVRPAPQWAAAVEALRDAVGRSPFLRRVDDGGEVMVLVPSVDDGGAETSLGDLSSLAGHCWLALAPDGRPTAPLRSLTDAGADALVRDLEGRSRQRQLVRLHNRQPDPLHGKVELVVHRWRAEAGWREADEGTVFRLGERFAISIINNHPRLRVYVHLLGLGFGGSICLLYPRDGEQSRLVPGGTVSFGMDGPPMRFVPPPEFPYLRQAPRRRERERFKLVASTEPTDFRLFFQKSFREVRDDQLTDQGLGGLLRWFVRGSAFRGEMDAAPPGGAWTTVDRGQWIDTTEEPG